MITHNRIDMALRSTGPAEVIDLGEPGGLEWAHFVVVAGSAAGVPDEDEASSVSVTVEGCATKDGSFATALELELEAGAEHRGRIPLEWPRYIRLAEEGATLTVRV